MYREAPSLPCEECERRKDQSPPEPAVSERTVVEYYKQQLVEVPIEIIVERVVNAPAPEPVIVERIVEVEKIVEKPVETIVYVDREVPV